MTRLVASFLAGFGADTRAAAAVEMVLILPLAVLLTAITMEAGAYLYTEHQVVKGVRDAARYAARLPFSTYNCTAASGAADVPTAGTAGTAWGNIANVAIYGNVAGSGERRVWTWTATGTNLSIQYACIAAANGIYSATGFAPQITVSGKPTYPSLFNTLAGFPATYRLYARQQSLGAGV
jgi:Flp pilus assembly protein TadG